MDAWRRLLRRVNQNKSPWHPSESDRVCSSHFVDGEPSVKNPNPTLNLGYEWKQDKSRCKLFRTPVSDKKITSTSSGSASAFAFCSENLPPEVKSSDSLIQSRSGNENQYDPMSEHDYCFPSGNIPGLTCQGKKEVIKSLVGKVNNQDDQITKLRKGGLLTYGGRSPFSWTKIKTDAKMKFYTGLSSVKLFHELFDLLKPFINKMNYWRGPVRTSTKIKSLEQREHKKMTLKNEFLSVLMWLKLALLNEDISDRFCVFPTISSNVFTTWIKVLNRTLRKALVVWLHKEVILEHLPAKFKKHHPKIHCVIDCSEVFIERPKAVDIQAAAWSDYKKHNTVKFLIGISPTGFITFLSDCYSGRASDQFLCKDIGFYELLDPYDEIMADRGFQIREELLLRFCTLTVPPGARLKSQMTSRECT